MNLYRMKNALITSLLALPATFAYTETVVLKNGSVLKGSLIEMNEVDATIETADMGRVVVKRRAIQSMSDEVAESSRIHQVQPPVSQPVVVSNNNSNDDVMPAKTAVNSQQNTAGASQNAVAMASNASVHSEQVRSTVALGYGAFNTLSYNEKSVVTSMQGPSLHVVPLKLQLGKGIAVALLGDAFSQSKLHETKTFYHGGVGFDWSSNARAVDEAGHAWSLGVSVGYGQLTTRNPSFNSYDADFYNNDTGHDLALQTAPGSFGGRVFGAQLAYSYFSAENVGVEVGFSYLVGKLDGNATMKSDEYYGRNGYYSEYYDHYNEKLKQRNIRAYLAHIGLSKRF